MRVANTHTHTLKIAPNTHHTRVVRTDEKLTPYRPVSYESCSCTKLIKENLLLFFLLFFSFFILILLLPTYSSIFYVFSIYDGACALCVCVSLCTYHSFCVHRKIEYKEMNDGPYIIISKPIPIHTILIFDVVP